MIVETAVPTIFVGTIVPTMIVGTKISSAAVPTALVETAVTTIIVGITVPTVIAGTKNFWWLFVGTVIPTNILNLNFFFHICQSLIT